MQRDTTMDLMRLGFMFMICLVHAVGCDNSRWTHWLTNVSFAGVLGFVLISGYYGIRFSWRKVLKIEGVGIGCALTVVSTAALLGSDTFTVQYFAQEVLRLFKGYWFVHAYVLLLCLSPLVPDSQTLKLSNPSNFQTFLPIVFVIYGWSFLAHLPGLNKVLPLTSGLEPFGGITLFAVYLIGRLYRLQDWDAKLRLRWVISLTVFCGLAVASIIPPTNGWAGVLARYNSPFLLGLALGLFWLLRRLPVLSMPWLVKILQVLTPSVFSIYLIHCNDYGLAALVGLEKALSTHGITGYVMFVALAAAAFVGGLVLDLPRRGVVSLVWRLNCILMSKGSRV